jgi:YgiT-type zinc finger domain-containing protein
MQTPLTHCVFCGGGDLQIREVEELLSVGDYVVRCKVPATVCLRCGERYFDPQTVRQFEDLRAQVRAGDLSGMRTAGALLEPVA